MRSLSVHTYLLAFCCLLSNITLAQNKLTIFGKITNEFGEAIADVNIVELNSNNQTISDEKGNFSIRVDFDDYTAVQFTHIQYNDFVFKVYPSNRLKKELNIQLSYKDNYIDSVEITAKTKNKAGEIELEAKSVEYFPNPTGDIGAVLKSTGLGTQSNTELSGQYSVRGGNYDENLVYVNDFEIYRSFLTSAGQQEGLSFPNLDLIDKLSFSSGGFESKYADKMSSVLNVKYKTPKEFKGSVMASLLGVNAHIEGSSKEQKFTYLAGVRYKSNAYLLGSLDKKGEYNPNFFDVQANFHYKPSNKHDVELLINHAFNKFNFIPDLQETKAGTFDRLIRFLVDFEGRENDLFQNSMIGLSYKFIPNDNLSLKWTTALWKMKEQESFNITGYYSLDEIDIDLSSDNFGNVKYNLGYGTFQDWARNTLDAIVWNGAFTGKLSTDKNFMEFGNTVQYENIQDKLSEWTRIDSAGYSLPYTGSIVSIQDRIKSANNLQSVRTHGYFQDTWTIRDDSVRMSITAGIRYHYWNVNKEFLASPRFQINFSPNTEKDVQFRFATGLYMQPPFYREIRNFDGAIVRDVKAQKSLHVVAGADLNFKAWGRNFKFTTEAYYKYIWNLNPYEIEDIRIRYFANNNAKAYATGIDLRLFGEMVKGTDSWISVSYLRTREDLNDDFYYTTTENNDGSIDSTINYPGYIRRPTDQLLYFNLYFQDYLVKNKSFKVHLNLVIGTGLPFGPPDHQRYKDVLKIPPYRRLDIGFSYLLVNGLKQAEKKPNGFWSKFDNVWMSFEVFNILGIQNTLSYRWIKDTQNTQWAIPNYLTSRRFNLKLSVNW